MKGSLTLQSMSSGAAISDSEGKIALHDTSAVGFVVQGLYDNISALKISFQFNGWVQLTKFQISGTGSLLTRHFKLCAQ